jgi:AAA domain/Primase C terminal 2 (PriCT-2)/Bifunctional DNA primase/polymerase, N-terminal
VSRATQDLLAFVRQLPDGFAYAPIYAKGEVLPSGSVSKGKTPTKRSHDTVMSPADVALQIERQPGVFQAVGVFTGGRSMGLVILDVDRNLSRLKKKWGETLEGAPVVTSTKANAAKYLFRVPEALWGSVQGFGLSDTGAGYEVLWGRQGVIYGAYPGSSDGKAPEGQYGFEGDLEAIPEAPGWLLAEMKERAGKGIEDAGFIRNRKALDFSDRDPAEVAEIIQSALKVIPGQGAGSRDHWVKVGMAIHSELPNDLGLTLWSAWSAEDPEFSQDWKEGNPCDAAWKSFRKGPVSLGTLFWMADQQMPGRLWLAEDLRKVVMQLEVDASPEQLPRFTEIMLATREALQLENPAEQKYELHKIAYKAKMRDAFELEKMYVDQVQYESQAETMTVAELLQQDFERSYLIPDLLPNPAVVLIYGAGGDGKSMAAWTLAKHVATGAPFVIRGHHVPVQQGPVLLLNGDQPLVQMQEQLQEIEMPADAPVTLRTDWTLQSYARFQRLMERLKPKLVVIDSLIGCSGGRAFDENKSDFATPLYWLTRNNGVLFPATTILIIHHANKTGGFRGTSAIRDAVDETWSLKRPSDKQVEQTGPNTRIITIEKSRSGRGGTSLLLRQEADLSFTLSDWTPEVDPTETTPSGVTDRVLQRLRVVYPAGKTREELNSDAVCGGSVAAIRKSLQRLEKRGLIQVSEVLPAGKGGRPVNVYQAVVALSRGEGEKECPLDQTTSICNGSAMGHTPAAEAECPTSKGAGETGGTQTQKSKPCPIADPLQDKGSEQVDTSETYPRVREERSEAELSTLMEEAARLWN